MKKITFLFMCLMTFSFANAQYASIAIVGDGTGSGGWPGEAGNPGPVDVHQMTPPADGGTTWTYDNLVTSLGSVKFRAENSWDNNWGGPTTGSTFPTATGVFNSATNISTPGGIYNVTFDTSTLVYTFTASNLYPVVSLIGPAVGSWETDVDMTTTDGITYTSTGLTLVAGAVKFRQDHTWSATTNWGATAFPTGTAVLDSQDAIDVPAGTYNITFNKNTLVYNFAYPSIAIVGSATPQGWPSDPQIDAHVLSTTDGITYTLNSITLVAGAAKFRQDNSWAVQWGGDGGFPSGIGSQNGTDIPVTAGTYSVTLNKTTGVYNFADPIAAVNNVTMASFKVYPNPTQSNWNFTSATENFTTIQVVDISGKIILTATPNSTTANVDASGLSSGIYFAKVATPASSSTIKLVKN